MKRWRVAGLAIVLVVAGCADDPSDVTAGELLGLWAAVEMVYTSQADPTVEADLVGAEGATYTIELRSDGTFASLLSGWMQGSVEESGTFEVRDNRLLLDGDEEGARRWDLEFNQSLLTAQEADGSWDFDGDGTREPATLHMLLDRL